MYWWKKMNYKEFLFKMSEDILNGLEIPNFMKNLAKKKMEEYFKDTNNDLDLELIFLKIIKTLKDVKYP
jgi:hypothetical protein